MADDISGDSYDVLRRRLADAARALGEQVDALDARRAATSGGGTLTRLGPARLRTEGACVPVDVVAIAGVVVVGLRTALGLRREIGVDDVLAVTTLVDGPEGLVLEKVTDARAAWTQDPRFLKDLKELFGYYRDARLERLRVDGDRLFASFLLGDRGHDRRVLHWVVEQGALRYVDNRGDALMQPPPSHDFPWTPTTSADHRLGSSPHVSIRDLVFVETVGGTLTVKVEDNTDDGQGIWNEPVDDPRQSLDDAIIEYAIVGCLVVMRVRPYGEAAFRHVVFHTRTQKVARLDGIGASCALLPDDHGVVFPGGFVLDTGEIKTFGTSPTLRLDRVVRAANGEDILYVFRDPDTGVVSLYPYNLVRREVLPPVEGTGTALLDDGRAVLLRAETTEAARAHTAAVWETPFCTPEHHETRPRPTGLLGRVGNADLVRGIADAYALVRRATLPDPTRAVYVDLASAAATLFDDHPWLKEPEAGELEPALVAVRAAADAILGEYDKVESLKRRAEVVIAEAEKAQGDLVSSLRPDLWREAGPYLDALARLRLRRGQLATLEEVRFVDRERLGRLQSATTELFETTAKQAARFLADPSALADVRARIADVTAEAEQAGRTPDLQPIAERLAALTAEVEALGEVSGNLPVDDPALRTALVQQTAEVTALVNRARATLARRRDDLGAAELKDEFAARFALLGQAVDGALSAATSPEAVDAQLARLLLQVEELESRFGEVGEFLPVLVQKREEIASAFQARRQQLLDARQRRIGHLAEAAARVLEGVGRKAASIQKADELRAFFAGDAMAAKVRSLADEIAAAGDSGRAEELRGRLKAVEATSLRALADRDELYEDGGKVLKLGRFRFPVQPLRLDLTLVPRDGGLALHLAGTDFFEPIRDPAVLALRQAWEHPLPSESGTLPRAAWLAGTVLLDAEARRDGLDPEALRAAAVTEASLLALVQGVASRRLDEGYERGVHDVDATKILAALLGLVDGAERLRWPATARVLGLAYWVGNPSRQAALRGRARSLGALRTALGDSAGLAGLAAELTPEIAGFREAAQLPEADGALAAAWLVEELSRTEFRPVLSADADRLVRAAEAQWGGPIPPEVDLSLLGQRERLELVGAWLRAVDQATSPTPPASRASADVVLEAAAAVALGDGLPRKLSSAPVAAEVTGLLAQHESLKGGAMTVRLDELLARVARHRVENVPRWAAWRALRHELLEKARVRLRLDELIPKPMTSFVRNRLIQEVYLPLIGANLAKQLGAGGEGKRTDQMGLLLLISPPGYGKTTLMEYVAQRLGLVFVKVNGPSLGHRVKSLDPAEAPDLTSRQEVEKIGQALEMGSNVMLYLDDIQHTDPELLQKFISLCDATRRIEGVYNGVSRTYDLRGKRFCIAMAGNPYTESGEQFKVPDMLANRADTYNLGDILGGAAEAFGQSFLENALTSNPALAPLATRGGRDLRPFLRLARGEDVAASAFDHDWSEAERQDVVAVLRHLQRIQCTVLAVNQAYIASAAIAAATRESPPFKLQGSYRNMNKMAEKVAPAMTAEEVDQLVTDHYAGEAQTLTTGAEANLLALAGLRGTRTPEQEARWRRICDDWRRTVLIGGTDDPAAKVTGALLGLGDKLGAGMSALGERLDSTQGGGGGAVDVDLRPLVAALEALRSEGAPLVRAVEALRASDAPLVRAVAGLTRSQDKLVAPLEAGVDKLHHVAAYLGPKRGLLGHMASLEGVLAAVFADLGSRAPVAEGRQDALVEAVREALEQPFDDVEIGEDVPTSPGELAANEGADPVLAATVPVLVELAHRIARLMHRLLPEEEQAKGHRALKEEVAAVALKLARARAELRPPTT